MDRPPFIVWFEHSSVAAAAISGVLAARGRRIDLFGVSVLALVTAFGGGTVRDLCLGDTPVFWIRNSDHVITALIFAFLTFFTARSRQLPMPPWLLELADAIGLSLFAIIGAEKALVQFQATPLAAVALGTVTSVSGGILRDVILNEIPLVFRREIKLYAVAAMAGATLFVILEKYVPSMSHPWPFLISVGTILALRLAAIRWSLALPEFIDRRRS